MAYKDMVRIIGEYDDPYIMETISAHGSIAEIRSIYNLRE